MAATMSPGEAQGSTAEAPCDGRLEELLPLEYTRPATLMDFHAAVVPKSSGGELLKLLGSHCAFGPELLHLKRVRPAEAAPNSLQVLLCPADAEPPAELCEFLASPRCGAERSVIQVPRFGAMTRSQQSDFSRHWPLTFRKPSFVPLEITDKVTLFYGRLLQRAVEVGGGLCGCVIVDKAGREVVAAADESSSHPLRHAVMVAIERVAGAQLDEVESGAKRPRTEEDYLCQDCEVVTTHEPCIMCAMALVHSRVKIVAYRTPDREFGGLGGKVSLHTCQSLNHQFRVLRWAPR